MFLKLESLCEGGRRVGARTSLPPALRKETAPKAKTETKGYPGLDCGGMSWESHAFNSTHQKAVTTSNNVSSD